MRLSEVCRSKTLIAVLLLFYYFLLLFCDCVYLHSTFKELRLYSYNGIYMPHKTTNTVFLRLGCITVRKRQTYRGTYSLHMDIYRGGLRRYDFQTLKGLEITGVKSRDKDVRKLVESIVFEFNKELIATESGVGYVSPVKLNADFITYFERLANKRQQKSWSNSLVHLRKFSGSSGVQFRAVTEQWLERFQQYLLGAVSETSAHTYFSTIKAALSSAVKDKILVRNPASDAPSIKRRDRVRAFLSEEELQKLYLTPCNSDTVKRAFLFSCRTGLRLSDVKALQWENVRMGKENAVDVVQQKTGRLVSVPLRDDAIEMLGEQQAYGTVFALLGDEHTRKTIKRWVASAGIEKNVSFHTARHTFATSLQAASGDIYMVSTVLGHTSTKHTQVYAKMTNPKLREGMAKIPSMKSTK